MPKDEAHLLNIIKQVSGLGRVATEFSESVTSPTLITRFVPPLNTILKRCSKQNRAL